MNNLTYEAVKNLFHLVNTMFDEPILPDTRYLIDKLATSSSDVTFHFVCEECSEILSFNYKNNANQEIIVCDKCTTTFSKKSVQNKECFITWDISQDLKDLIEDNEEYYNFVVRLRNSISD